MLNREVAFIVVTIKIAELFGIECSLTSKLLRIKSHTSPKKLRKISMAKFWANFGQSNSQTPCLCGFIAILCPSD